MHPGIDVSMRVVSALSIIGSGCVVLVFVLNSAVRNKLYNKLILCVAICDFFGSIGANFGTPREGSPECWIQGLSTNYFPLASLFWTTVIAIVLVRLTIKNHINPTLPNYYNYFCWGAPLVLTLLPLTTNTYGTYGDDESGWCFIEDRADSPYWTAVFWVIVSFYFWFWLVILFYLVAIPYVIHVVRMKATFVSPMIQGVLKRIIWYPINIVICWTSPAIYDIIEIQNPSLGVVQSATFEYFSFVLPTSQGLLNAIAFFTTNPELRHDFLIQLGWISRDTRVLSMANAIEATATFRDSVKEEPAPSDVETSQSNSCNFDTDNPVLFTPSQ